MLKTIKKPGFDRDILLFLSSYIIEKITNIMFKKITKTGALLILLLSLNACGPNLKPFTKSLYEERNWSEEELKRVQFYVSEDIVLRRELAGNSFEVLAGEIKIVDGRKVEEILIKKGTPGGFVFSPKANRLAISFESSDQRYLIFGPNPKTGGRFVLLASDWNRYQGKVTYEGQKYNVSSRSAYAALMVDLKKIRKTSVSSRTARGRKVSK